MFKQGFTLAEVLITLGLIGVVSALTLPGLLTDTTSAQIGPRLAKARTTFEQANQALLHESNVDGITTAFSTINTNSSGYTNALTDYMKATSGISYSGATYTSITDFPDIPAEATKGRILLTDGSMFVVAPLSEISCAGIRPHQCMIGAVYVDISGQNPPNVAGTDLFAFSLWNDGSLRPVGGGGWMPGGALWGTQCPIGAAPTNPLYCSGHVFENELKVLYN